jgi:preprotein translocase subunit SecB
MSETNTPPEDNKAAAPEGTQDPANQPGMRILDRYIKDLSFESPNAPMSLNPMLPAPKFEAQVGVNARQVGPEQYEVELSCAITAKHDTNVTYVVEINYAGLFMMQNMTEEMIERTMLVDCPARLFPYMRLVIADATRNGGFTPLIMESVNFVDMYEKQKASGKVSADGPPPATDQA